MGKKGWCAWGAIALSSWQHYGPRPLAMALGPRMGQNTWKKGEGERKMGEKDRIGSGRLQGMTRAKIYLI